MADNEQSDFHRLAQDIAELQSQACVLGLERQYKPMNIYNEEYEKSKEDIDKNETLKIILQTTNIARFAMTLIDHCVTLGAVHISQKSKYFTSLSSAIAYLRDQEELPKHLLLEWERNLILMDLFITNKGLYCSKRLAQDMFDICMETFDWLRSLCNNNK